jgi:hypothetical protein
VKESLNVKEAYQQVSKSLTTTVAVSNARGHSSFGFPVNLLNLSFLLKNFF